MNRICGRSNRRGPNRLFAVAIPLLLLLIPAYPALSMQAFKLREPTFLAPLAVQGPLKIRRDPYGSGEFGARRRGGRPHRGVDLLAPMGTPIVASKSGRAMIGRRHNGMGRYVEVRHPDGSMTRYGHLRQISIRDGQRVWRGAVLGTVGKTGNAGRRLIQPHLHFEVWSEAGVPVDPLPVMEAKDESLSKG